MESNEQISKVRKYIEDALIEMENRTLQILSYIFIFSLFSILYFLFSFFFSFFLFIYLLFIYVNSLDSVGVEMNGIFYLPYHGYNDRDIIYKYSHIYHNLFKEFKYICPFMIISTSTLNSTVNSNSTDNYSTIDNSTSSTTDDNNNYNYYLPLKELNRRIRIGFLSASFVIDHPHALLLTVYINIYIYIRE